MAIKTVFPWGILTKHLNKVQSKKYELFTTSPRGGFPDKRGYRIVEFTAKKTDLDAEEIMTHDEELEY